MAEAQFRRQSGQERSCQSECLPRLLDCHSEFVEQGTHSFRGTCENLRPAFQPCRIPGMALQHASPDAGRAAETRSARPAVCSPAVVFKIRMVLLCRTRWLLPLALIGASSAALSVPHNSYSFGNAQ